MKLSCRTSTAWRIARPSSSGGSSARNAAKSSGSNFLVGAICQRIGPSFDSSSSTPLAKNRSIEEPASASTRRLVANCGPLSENTKSSGVSSGPFAEARGLLRAVEGAVDLDRGELAAGVFEFARLRQSLRKERAAPGLEHPAADADADHGAFAVLRGYARPAVSKHAGDRCATREGVALLAERRLDARVRAASPIERARHLHSCSTRSIAWASPLSE